METVLEVDGVNGDHVVLAGRNAGSDGIWLASELTGFYDPEIDRVTRAPANRPGTRLVSHRVLERTVVFKVTISNDEGPGRTWRERDARWRKLFAYDKLTTIRVVTDEGERELKVVLEGIEVDTTYDPHTSDATDVVMTVIAPDPFWYGPDEVHEVSVRGTTNIEVLVANPTENPVFPVWVLEAPGTWTIPDWGENEQSKTIQLPAISGSSHVVVDTDPGARQLVAVDGDPVWQRMNGVRFRNHIPGYTNRIQFRVRCDSGSARKAQLRLRRPFNRPWGA